MLKLTSLRILLFLVVTNIQTMKQLDVSNAFSTVISMKSFMWNNPKGSLTKTNTTMFASSKGLCTAYGKLQRSLYSLWQALRQWFLTLKYAFLALNFIHFATDTTLFFYKSHSTFVVCLVYVDDIIIMCNITSMIQ